MLLQLVLYIVAFIFIWYGSGLIIASASKFSSKLKLSPFAFSLVFLGLLTSTPEFSVGLQAVASHDPEIFVGNLLGGLIVLFLIVIPALAIFGNGVSLKHEFDKKTLMVTMAVILAPALLILDGKATTFEGTFLIGLYLMLLFLVQRKNGIFDTDNAKVLDLKAYSYKDLLKLLLGIAIVFAASNIIVDKTVYFAGFLGISAFYIGLLIIALGTDLPELTLAIRSVASGKKDIAMGDYVGAAAASTFLFGLFTFLHQDEVLIVGNFSLTFFFIAVALSLFYYFSVTKKYISRSNGLMMVGVYILFVVFELAS